MLIWRGCLHQFCSGVNVVIPTARPTKSRASKRRRWIVVTTWGTLGDLYPYIAIALGLQARGHEVVMATSQCYQQKIESLGLGFHAVRPDSDWLSALSGVQA